MVHFMRRTQLTKATFISRICRLLGMKVRRLSYGSAHAPYIYDVAEEDEESAQEILCLFDEVDDNHPMFRQKPTKKLAEYCQEAYKMQCDRQGAARDAFLHVISEAAIQQSPGYKRQSFHRCSK